MASRAASRSNVKQLPSIDRRRRCTARRRAQRRSQSTRRSRSARRRRDRAGPSRRRPARRNPRRPAAHTAHEPPHEHSTSFAGRRQRLRRDRVPSGIHESSRSSRLHHGRGTRHADEERHGEGAARGRRPPDVALGRHRGARRGRRARRRDPRSPARRGEGVARRELRRRRRRRSRIRPSSAAPVTRCSARCPRSRTSPTIGSS